MKKAIIFASISIFFISIYSCSKSETASNNSSNTYNSSITGIWLLNKIRINSIGISGYYTGLNSDTTIFFNDGSYSNFKNDGIVYSANFQNPVGHIYDTASYQLSGLKLIFIPNNAPADTANVLSLNNTLLSIYKTNIIVQNNPQYPNENGSYEQKLYFDYTK